MQLKFEAGGRGLHKSDRMIRIFVVALVHHSGSAVRVAQLKAATPPCVSLRVIQYSAARRPVQNKIDVLEKAQQWQAAHGGLVGYVEDDTIWHSRFCDELNKTVASLPPSWGVLHLCPGFAWGRKLRPHTTQFNPERAFPVPRNPRAWSEPPDRSAWLGGPEAVLWSQPRHVNSVIEHMRRGMGITDIDMTLDAFEHPGRDYIARDPPLCREGAGASIRRSKLR